MRKENFDDAWAFLQSALKTGSGGAEPAPATWTDIWEELIDRAPRLLLPLAMDTFDTGYMGDEAMIIMEPPDMSRISDPMLSKRTTDIRFGVKESDTTLRRYHVAALDSLSPTMTTYMMAYNFCDATEFADELEGRLIFQWPRSMVLCFNGGETAPDELPMNFGLLSSIPGLEIPAVPVVNASAGTIEEMLEHDLLILLPFFLQRYTQDMDFLNEDEVWLDEVAGHYRLMGETIREKVEDGSLRLDDAIALGDAIAEGVRSYARNFPNVQKKIGSVVQEEIVDALPDEDTSAD